MKIPYTLVSMAAILRDYADMSNAYINIEHKRLVDIADSLYNVGITPDDFKTEYKKLYDQYGKAYFDKVLDDMYALDGQLTSDAKVQELIDDYSDRLSGITASTKVTASINLIDKLGYIKNRNGKFDICLVETPFAEMELATYDPIEDEYDILTKVKDVADAYDQANKLFKTQDEYVINSSTKVSASNNPFYDKLSDYNKRIVDNLRKQFSPSTFDVYNALLPYIGEYSSTTGWTGSCDLMQVKDKNTADGYLYKVIWDDHDVDIFSWKINDNPRVGGDFTLMIMPAHGMPMFCDSEKDFYRAVRKVFGDGLEKIN